MRAVLHIRTLVALLVAFLAICALAQRASAALAEVRPPGQGIQQQDPARAATAFYTVDYARRPEADPSGIYQGHAPAADAAKRVFTLNLAADGTAILTTLYIGKNDATQHGRWTQNGSQILLTFDAMGPNRPPHPITFRHRGHELSPIHWDPSEWGKAGPPVLHRSLPKTAGIVLDPQAASQRPAPAGF
jgi:NlpE N-terminal domain